MPRFIQPVDAVLGEAINRVVPFRAVSFQKIGFDQAAHGALRGRERCLVGPLRKTADRNVDGSDNAKPIGRQERSQPDGLLELGCRYGRCQASFYLARGSIFFGDWRQRTGFLGSDSVIAGMDGGQLSCLGVHRGIGGRITGVGECVLCEGRLCLPW